MWFGTFRNSRYFTPEASEVCEELRSTKLTFQSSLCQCELLQGYSVKRLQSEKGLFQSRVGHEGTPVCNCKFPKEVPRYDSLGFQFQAVYILYG